MRRGAYIGNAAIGGSGFPGIPLQAETVAYLARFSTAPSQTYKNALNQFIYRLKKASILSQIQDLWLLCADTQADSLRNFVAAARDATLSGAPTFTALKGFSNLSGSNKVILPFSTTGLAADTAGFATAISAAVPTPSSNIGIIGSGNGGIKAMNGGNGIAFSGVQFGGVQVNSDAVNPTPVLVGQIGGTSIDATHIMNATGAGGATLTSTPLVFNSTSLPRIMAHAVMPTPTAVQVRKFLSVLSTFLDDIGAL